MPCLNLDNEDRQSRYIYIDEAVTYHKLTIVLAREERKKDDHEAQGVHEGVRSDKV